MSTVQLALERVKKMSAREAKDLLGWLDGRKPGRKTGAVERGRARETALDRRKRKFRSWHDSVRGVTDWEPSRMPDDLVKRVRL